MGMYLNPGNDGFQRARNSQIYVDKSGLIAYTNTVFNTEQQYVCVSRPRRFGKSMAANMLAAYYGLGIDSKDLFNGLEIEQNSLFEEHLNKYNVIFLNMQEFLSETNDIAELKELIEKSLLWDLIEAYPDIPYFNPKHLTRTLADVFRYTKIPFVFIIDEWDCIFRENRADIEAQKTYLDFLRNLLKDKKYVALAYMTGILPIKKYGTQKVNSIEDGRDARLGGSALNMFDEFSMTNPSQLAEFVGFTESEVERLCSQYHMDFDETRRWYDGYCFEKVEHVYSPRSVVSAMLNGVYDNYWNKTETFEALRDYIVMNFDGLQDTITLLLAGERKVIDTGSFKNDMTTFSCADDVLTLLVHLGYLGYDFASKEVFIPNSEIASEFVRAIKSAGWDQVIKSVQKSENLLKATWDKNTKAVAEGVEEAHLETSILTYNDENALSCTIALAYYAAKAYYQDFRELPAGKGFADIVYLPRRNHLDKPAMIVELKWAKSAEGAIAQIKERKYIKALEDYKGNLLLVGINYNKENKVHECVMEELQW